MMEAANTELATIPVAFAGTLAVRTYEQEMLTKSIELCTGSIDIARKLMAE